MSFLMVFYVDVIWAFYGFILASNLPWKTHTQLQIHCTRKQTQINCNIETTKYITLMIQIMQYRPQIHIVFVFHIQYNFSFRLRHSSSTIEYNQLVHPSTTYSFHRVVFAFL
eukprot:205930_1